MVAIKSDQQEEVCPDTLDFARSYQLEALEKAIKQNTIVFLETGSGKTLIAIMLLRSYAHFLRKPSPFIAVFLVPTVVLVTQQADAVKMHTDLKVGKFWGEMGVDFWDPAMWKKQLDQYELLVMTPAILLDALRRSFLHFDTIKLLIFDECHNARGKHPYASIMTDFYHHQLASNNSQLPRIFGMTASPVKAKGSSSSLTYWNQISDLENLMHAKVYTCTSESVLAKHIPFSTAKVKTYKHLEIPYALFESLVNDLNRLRDKHESSLRESNLSESAMDSAKKRLSRLYAMFSYCFSELGAWLALKAAESLMSEGDEVFSWTKLDVCGETMARDFISDAYKVFSAYIPSGPGWSVGSNMSANVDAGYLTTKVICLVESLAEYRDLKDLRCIIFVERVIAAIVLQSLLHELLPKLGSWKAEYTAGHHSGFQAQSRKTQNNIVEEFRKGNVNIIVATSILEEGLDVQSCNLVIRFDPSSNVCSFIQSRGRARMQNSEFLLLVKSGDDSTLTRVNNYLASGDIMRQESLRHASIPCASLDRKLCDEVFYRVDTTGAIVTLSSSVSLIYFYCSRLPSDGYFKPHPRCVIDKELGTCIIYFPKSCPLPSISVSGSIKMLKQLACLEACKQLHLMGALNDHLVPDIVVEEAEAHESASEPYVEEQAKYIPAELVCQTEKDSSKFYYCYSIEMRSSFDYDVPLHDAVLALNTMIQFDDDHLDFELEADRGKVSVFIIFIGNVNLTSEQVLLCQRFQLTLFKVLFDHSFEKLQEVLEAFYLPNVRATFDYLLLPSTGSHQYPVTIDWKAVASVLFSHSNLWDNHKSCSYPKSSDSWAHTKNGLLCRCLIENSLVYTPHNGHMYCVTRTLHNLNSNSLLNVRDGEAMTYKKYYEEKYGIVLKFERESFLNARHVFTVQNLLQRCRQQKDKGPSKNYVELPPELCFIIMSPMSISTLYSFSFIPSIMHRIESFLIALNLKKMHSDHCTRNVDIPTLKVLEAITTKKCHEKFHLESLETLGDSFLKYATSQQLFKTLQNQHEGILSARRQRIITNTSLCKLGCDCKIQGFIRNEPFDPKMWIIPGDRSGVYTLDEGVFSTRTKVYCGGRRKVKSKTVADVVEALIGAFLSSGGELAALSFMDWLGIKVDFVNIPYERNFPVHPERLLNIGHLESLLKYSFKDRSLLVEALTHGSYMLPEIPRCYQRLEYLGDAVLDYLITTHLYTTYPGLSPGQLTDLRSASVNNDCYAQSAIKAELHKHVLHASQELQRHIVASVCNFEQSAAVYTFGFEAEINFPKVLGDVIESLAGAIFVDSGYSKDAVFHSIRPLLEPLITPETVALHPVQELNELCQKSHYNLKKPVVTHDNGVASITVEVEANGQIYKDTRTASDKKLAQKLASKTVLKYLKDVAEKGLTIDDKKGRREE